MPIWLEIPPKTTELKALYNWDHTCVILSYSPSQEKRNHNQICRKHLANLRFSQEGMAFLNLKTIPFCVHHLVSGNEKAYIPSSLVLTQMMGKFKCYKTSIWFLKNYLDFGGLSEQMRELKSHMEVLPSNVLVFVVSEKKQHLDF